MAGSSRRDETTTRFRRRVAVLIAVASIAGVLSAWAASREAGAAAGFQQQGLQHLVHLEQELNKNEGLLDQDRRLDGLYERHVEARKIYSDQAAQLGSGSPRLRDGLAARAREHLTIARSLYRFFLTQQPPPPHVDDYEPRTPSASTAPYFEDDLAELRPEHLFRQAKEAHLVALLFSAVTASFAVALFLLTLAELARSDVRRYIGVSGGGVVMVGLVGFAAVLVGAR